MLMPSPSTVVAGLLEVERHEPRTIELWDAWTFAEMDAEFALKRWWDVVGDETVDAFRAYRAAVDREEQAAAVLAARLFRTSPAPPAPQH